MAAKTERTLWGIHGGKSGEADELFLKHGVIAMGWSKLGDLGSFPPERDAFRRRLIEIEPNKKEGYYNIVAGQLFRFTHEAKLGDLVIYPSKRDRLIHMGEITGPFRYDTKANPSYPQHRPVKWLQERPRTVFSQGALYEIGSAMTFFQVKNFADEFLAALSSAKPALAPAQDESVSFVAEEIDQNTRDFIFKKLAQELKGHALADFVAHLLRTMGFRTTVSPEGPDGGVDIIAHKDELGFEPPIIKVQVKSTEGSTGEPVVAQILGKLDPSEYGMVVTLGPFTHQAVTFARNKANLRLIDGEKLVDLVLQHYDKFEAKYKGLIPLTRVYVPEPLEEDQA